MTAARGSPAPSQRADAEQTSGGRKGMEAGAGKRGLGGETEFAVSMKGV